jgi:alpha-methylacyl-CoA racemase
MGPLSGIKIIELAGIGPAPFCGMLLADMGAEVLRIERPGPASPLEIGTLNRGRRRVVLDLKDPAAVQTALALVEAGDGLIEGFRPGVMERLGLGPEVCLERNPRLVYGRMTGWGQTGPLASAAGHDITYIALSGALHAIGPTDGPPIPPLNLVGDFGGGGMLLALGLVCGLLEARQSGRGQVVDAAMTEGAALQMAAVYDLFSRGHWRNQRGSNLLDGGAPFYGTYACRDGAYVAIGSLEPQFYALLLERCGISDPAFLAQSEQAQWPLLKTKLAEIFKTKTRAEWCALLEGTDVCFAPALDLAEAPAHPHNQARQTFVEVDGVVQPAPAPRFSRTVPELRSPAASTENPADVLREWGAGIDAKDDERVH